MADLTARFGADFTQFATAADGATAVLENFDAEAKSVQTTLNTMTESFSGQNVIAEATVMTQAVEDLGSAATLTEDELNRFHVTASDAATQLNGIGVGVPANMQAAANATKGASAEVSLLGSASRQLGGLIAGAFTVSAVVGFVKGIADAASEINETAAKTGLLTDEVQALQAIARDTDVNFSSLVSATQNLQSALGSGDEGVIGGIKALGINFAEFQSLGTYDQMLAIGRSIAAIEDPTERAAAAAAIFGRNWKEILPALLADMEKLGSEGPKHTERVLAAFDQFDKDWKKFTNQVSVLGGQIVAAFVEVGVAAETWMDNMATLPDYWKYMFGGAESVEAAKQARMALEATARETETLGTAAQKTSEDVVWLGNKGGDLAKAMREAREETEKSTKATGDHGAAAKKAADEMAGWAAAFESVNTAGTDYHETLDGLDEQFVTHLQNLLQAGADLNELAKAYGLSAKEAKAFKAAQDESTKGLADATKEANALTAEFLKTGADALKQFATTSKDSLQEVADKTGAAYGVMSSNSEQYSEEAIADQYAVARAAQIAADDFTVASASAAHAAEQAHAQAAQAVTMSWQQAMSAVAAGQGTMSGTIGANTDFSDANKAKIQEAFAQGRYAGPVKYTKGSGLRYGDDIATGPDWEALGFKAAGGPVSAGSPYVVGEQGPELFVPDRGGTIVPNGGGGGMVANIYVNGTGQDVARIINAELTRMMRVGRKWPSV